MNTPSGLIKAGICLVISVSGLASILLCAAYQLATKAFDSGEPYSVLEEGADA